MDTFWIALTALASWALVIVTYFLVRAQIKISRETFTEQLKISREDIKVRHQLIYEEKFDSSGLVAERKKLAEQLLKGASHDDIQEEVMNFFETVGMLLRRDYLDIDMAWCGFSFYAIRWWSVCKDYILEERKIQNNDETIFEEFEKLVDELYKVEMKERNFTRAELEPSQQDLKRFLEAEMKL